MESAVFESEKATRDRLEASKHLTTSDRALLERLKGKQPILNLAGQNYFVNWGAACLEREGIWIDIGIKFCDLEDFYREDYSCCDLPYNCRTHQMVKDIGQLVELTEMPKDIVIISFPPPEVMDRVGYARNGGGSLADVLAERNQVQHFKGKVLSGKDNWLEQIVNSNRKEKGLRPIRNKNSKGRGRSC